MLSRTSTTTSTAEGRRPPRSSSRSQRSRSADRRSRRSFRVKDLLLRSINSDDEEEEEEAFVERRYHINTDDDTRNHSAYDMVGVDLTRDGLEHTAAYPTTTNDADHGISVVQRSNTSSYHQDTTGIPTPRQRSSGSSKDNPRSSRSPHHNHYSTGVPTFATLAPDNLPTHIQPQRSPSTYQTAQDKKDRRPIFQRLHEYIRRHVQFPTLGYTTIRDGHEQHRLASLPELRFQLSTQFSPQEGTWMNTTDPAGLGMALLVWVLVLYGAMTMLLLARRGHVAATTAAFQCTLCTAVWACHAKCMLTDPGAIPATAIPLRTTEPDPPYHTMCSVCQSYKPVYTHHCRICNRCVSRMDHHCPWMNNCVGAANLKHFILFLVYTWWTSASTLIIFGWNYFFCAGDNCEFHGVEIQLVRVMSCICLGSLLFTTSMMLNVIYGIMTGTGTIDRLKQKADSTWHLSEEDPIPLPQIFGNGPVWGWFLPIDPVWDDFEQLMGYGLVVDEPADEQVDFT